MITLSGVNTGPLSRGIGKYINSNINDDIINKYLNILFEQKDFIDDTFNNIPEFINNQFSFLEDLMTWK